MDAQTKSGKSDRSFLKDFIQLPLNNRARVDVLHKALREAIQTELTPRQREIILMRWFERKRICDIAQELGLDPSTVSRTSKRAEARLKKALRFYVEYLNCASLLEQ